MIDAYAAFNEQFPWFFRITAFVFGAIVGSFLNVCIYRIPAEKSIVRPGSTCACGKPVAWHDNIPIVSWIVLRGRARCCGRPFSVRYPFVELLTGVLFFLCWLFFPPLVALCGMLFCAMLICATFIDFDHMIIPDRFTIGGAVVGVVLSILVPALHGFDSGVAVVDSLGAGITSIIGVLIGSAVVLWIALLAEVVLKKEAMGFGDVKFLGAIGAFTGWEGAVFAVFGGAVLGTIGLGVVLLVRLVFRRKNGGPEPEKKPLADPAGEEDVALGRMVPFGPMLALGGLLYFLFLAPWVDDYFASAALLFQQF
jgi:leader peptidase (prepilin peptidase) / N-methyltransferase